MFQFAALILSLVPLTLAQSDTALQIEAIEAHFQQSGIVPSLLPTFNPLATLSLNFAGEFFFTTDLPILPLNRHCIGVGTVSPGQALTHDS
jgi:phosphatidylethanolamine-binding protein